MLTEQLEPPATAKTAPAALYNEIVDPNGFDFSKVSIEELLAVRKHARDLQIVGDYPTRRRALAALVEIEDVLMLRLTTGDCFSEVMAATSNR